MIDWLDSLDSSTPAIALYYLTAAFPRNAGLVPVIGENLRGPYLSCPPIRRPRIEPSLIAKFLNIPQSRRPFWRGFRAPPWGVFRCRVDQDA